MNFILSIGVLFSMFVSVIYSQYYPHRYPVQQQPYTYHSANSADNPFQRAHENQGYYQRFADYGRQKSKPQVKQSHNSYSSDDKGKGKGRGKGKGNAQQKQVNHEDDQVEYDFENNLDYNDQTGGKDFDPFKYINDGVSGVDNYANIEGLGDVGDHFDYNIDFNSEY